MADARFSFQVILIVNAQWRKLHGNEWKTLGTRQALPSSVGGSWGPGQVCQGHQHPGCRHVELCSAALGDGHQGGTIAWPLAHGGWHEGCMRQHHCQFAGPKKMLLLDRHWGPPSGHFPWSLPPHGKTHQDLHERRPWQEAIIRAGHTNPGKNEEVKSTTNKCT